MSSSFSFTRLAVGGDEDEDREEINGGNHSHSSSGHAEKSFIVESKGQKEGDQKEEEQERRLDDSHVTSATAKQIMHLINELEMTTSGLNKHVVPCTCCTGELVVV